MIIDPKTCGKVAQALCPTPRKLSSSSFTNVSKSIRLVLRHNGDPLAHVEARRLTFREGWPSKSPLWDFPVGSKALQGP